MNATKGYVIVDANRMNIQSVYSFAGQIAGNLCAVDLDELSDATSANPFDAIMFGVENANSLYFIFAQGEPMPLAVGGVGKDPVIEGKGWIWLLSSAAMEKHPRVLIKGATQVLPQIMAKYQFLENYVHSSNHSMQRILHRAGFKVEAPAPWGMYGRPFCRFTWSNPNVS